MSVNLFLCNCKIFCKIDFTGDMVRIDSLLEVLVVAV